MFLQSRGTESHTDFRPNPKGTDMTNATNTIGQHVRVADDAHKFHGQTGVVVEIARGWISVDMDDTETETIAKFRTKQLEEFVEETKAEKTMSSTLRKARAGYDMSVTKGGRKSQKSPKSAVGRILEGYDHAEVAQVLGFLVTGSADEEMLQFYFQYKHLNNGQMRMNCGNRLNAMIKRGEIDESAVEEAKEACGFYPTEVLDAKHRPERLPKAA